TPTEPVDSLIMEDEHLNTIPATESDEFIKSCAENLVPNPIESESLSVEDVREKIYLNPLFDEEIIPMDIDPHSFNGIDETDCNPEKEIRLTKRLLYDNSSPRPPEEIFSDN
nr:hypothetical protein [Tanacetum cinerariifolium]